MTDPARVSEKSSTGLDANVAGMLTYLVGFVTGVVFLAVEKDSKFVRFHAVQSTIVFGALFVIYVILTMIPFLGLLLMLVMWPVGLILWILLMIKAYQGEKFKLPIAGDIAEQQVSAR